MNEIGKNITQENFSSSLAWPAILQYVAKIYKKNINDDDGWIFTLAPNEQEMTMLCGALSALNVGNNRLYLNINQLLTKSYLYELLIKDKNVFICSSVNVENIKNAMTIAESFGIKIKKLIYLFEDKKDYKKIKKIKMIYPELKLICGPSTIGENK